MPDDLRWLPSVNAALARLDDLGLPRRAAVAVVRRVLDELRRTPPSSPTTEKAHGAVQCAALRLARSRLRTVINATGVILHTNLGRAPMSDAVARRVDDVITHYNTLEYDLNTGERGGRAAYLEHNLAVLCDAAAATVVNNCAAALVLILRALAPPPKSHVIVSRGELVQIGGGFRVPDILAASGVTLREVGTTNQTTADDYRRAIDGQTAMVLKVHRSNFYLGGFVASPSTADLAALAREAGVAFVEDLGSGATFDTAVLGVDDEREPTPADALAAGADLVCFSGDKLLGGPQAGVIAGDARHVAACKRNPFFRALRCDKMVLAALDATTDALLDDRPHALPARAMMTLDVAALRERADGIAAQAGPHVSVCDLASRVGGGTLPRTRIASAGLAVSGPAQTLATLLRTGDPPIIGRVESGRLLLDLRTVFAHQDSVLADALRRLAPAAAS